MIAADFGRDVLPLPVGRGLDAHLKGSQRLAPASASGARKGRRLRRQEEWLR
jgi:hypothetical protein